eukprot:m.113591 g.113591  ORF g.113591 m.113591 type:complete len:276 (-) comp9138_c0_seq1:1039-1866(-)
MLAHHRPFGRDSKEQQDRADALVRAIVGCKLPPFILGQDAMLDFLKLLEPRFCVPNPKTVAASIMPSYVSRLLLQIRADLAKLRVLSLTLDMWTQHRHPFIVVTGHWITVECVLNGACFGLLYFPESRTAVNIRSRVLQLLTTLFSEEDIIPGPKCKVASLTTDTGANVKKMGQDSGWRWLPCFNHVLSLTVHDAIDLPEFAPVISRARDLVKAFRNTQALSVALSTRQRQANSAQRTLVLDVETLEQPVPHAGAPAVGEGQRPGRPADRQHDRS